MRLAPVMDLHKIRASKEFLHRQPVMAADGLVVVAVQKKQRDFRLQIIAPFVQESLYQRFAPWQADLAVRRFVDPDRLDDAAEIRLEIRPHVFVGLLQIKHDGVLVHHVQKRLRVHRNIRNSLEFRKNFAIVGGFCHRHRLDVAQGVFLRHVQNGFRHVSCLYENF